MSRQHRDTWVTVLAIAIALSASAAQGEVLSFAATRSSSLPQVEYDNDTFTYTNSEIKTDSSIASSVIASGMAQAQTDYGVNRVAVDNNVSVDSESLRNTSIGGPFATGISIWTDTFTVTGREGAGNLSVSATITGQFGPKVGPNYGSTGAYYLFVAPLTDVNKILAKPFEFLAKNDPCDVAFTGRVLCLVQSVPTPGHGWDGEAVNAGGAFGDTLTGSLNFNYGESFTLVSVLAGYANDFGILNSFHSAHFGITAPIGSSLVASTSTNYAPAVPEPSTSAMLIAGMVICLSQRRIKQVRQSTVRT